MTLLHETLPEFLGSLGAAAVLAGAAWGARRTSDLRSTRSSVNRFRRYTLLGTTTPNHSISTCDRAAASLAVGSRCLRAANRQRVLHPHREILGLPPNCQRVLSRSQRRQLDP
ncbi:hypothetical protein GCM10018780_38520 [Streptomyces lanatus]|nr:hypothetical protein GCM10018780_38520 [Streptomyces lanatus]